MDRFYQVSTLNSLMLGNLSGVISINELLKNGDYGIGTCEGLDGEMIVIDGTAYNGHASGAVQKYHNDDKVAFASVCRFSEHTKSFIIKDINNLKELTKKMTQLIKEEYKNKNVFYIVKIKVHTNYVKFRSCYKQNEPYRTLMEIMPSQVKFEYNNISGDIIGVFCPDYVDKLNMPGWHFHFISDDKTKGGHLFDLSFAEAQIDIDQKTQYEIILPTNNKFATINLSADLKKEVEETESEKEIV